MENSRIHYETLFARMEVELAQIKEEAADFHKEIERGMFITQQYMRDIKREVLAIGFSSSEEEIYFFKHVKPNFYSRLIFFQKVLYIIYNKPVGSKNRISKFLNKQAEKINYFFEKFTYFYHYCRSGDTAMDEKYFIRNDQKLLPGIEFYGVDTDPLFTTGYDFLVAKIKANELLLPFIEEELRQLQQVSKSNSIHQLDKPIPWTASKAALIELMYGLQSCGAIGNGNISLNDIAQFLEAIFQIKLGNYYRVFQEIRIRKKGRTQFLDNMKDQLIQKMDYWDMHPHTNS